jgi:hypothetical protein
MTVSNPVQNLPCRSTHHPEHGPTTAYQLGPRMSRSTIRRRWTSYVGLRDQG